MINPKNYRKRPLTIQALYWDGSDSDEMMDALHDFLRENMWHLDATKIYISTLEGMMSSKVPCYVLKGVRGEYYICEEEIFKETYEEV